MKRKLLSEVLILIVPTIEKTGCLYVNYGFLEYEKFVNSPIRSKQLASC